MAKQKKVEKEQRNFAKCFQMPAAVLPGGSRMELNGNREVIVEGCGGVMEYSEETVRVKTGRLVAKFTGRNLKIKCLTGDSLVVEGFITKLEFLT
mgnify:CR=1